VATYSFRLKNLPPRKVAEKLVAQNIYVWDGNYYALNVTERLELEDSAACCVSAQCITIPLEELGS